MKQTNRTAWALTGLFALLFLLVTGLVLRVDVAPVGPAGTVIGLSHLNAGVFALLGESELWYRLTSAFGGLALLVVLSFGLLGAVQLVRRRSLAAVDRDILMLGLIYLLTALLYVLFEHTVVNYRPVILVPSVGPEPSFPSSHTMLVCTVLGTAIPAWRRRLTQRPGLLRLVTAAAILIIVLTVAGRLLSGVHWFTDILAGTLLSAALISLYAALTAGENPGIHSLKDTKY